MKALIVTGAMLGTIAAATVPAQAAGAQAEAQPVQCTAGRLKAQVGRIDPAAGNRFAPLVLTNVSGRSCWTRGFVGLIMIDAHRDALTTRVRRDGPAGPRVVLAPGGRAVARLHWGAVETGAETSCPAPSGLLVIPPDERAFLDIPFKADRVCDHGLIRVGPLKKG
ncbi:DUF4232 domain-containing protein [Actinomadura sp. ATCC 31491]|uniref:DUF4232 domain-containing protein n=1 Tax=Actinomadura luzonensis TaxID=2805427 RepID=A0ABT0G3Q1_9ACTN|nr:DUF4232 domain-containing protein [Actinomadura luzonensis]MCK2218758.1 DUF4232 domain-containing protein [Actinomadura luzonensis]